MEDSFHCHEQMCVCVCVSFQCISYSACNVETGSVVPKEATRRLQLPQEHGEIDLQSLAASHTSEPICSSLINQKNARMPLH